MNCTICGKATLPGAMLCGPCKAALKRARYVTVQEDLRRPSIIDVRRKPRRTSTANAAAATPDAPPPTPSRATVSSHLLRPLLIGVAAMALLGTVAYFGQQAPSAHAPEVVTAAPPPPVLLARLAGDAKPAQVVVDAPPQQGTSVTTAPMPADASSSSSVSNSPATPGSNSVSTPDTFPHAAASPAASAKPGVAVGGKRASPRSSATFATANGDPPDASTPPPVPEKVAALPALPPPPAPDRWQTMRESIALCDREGLIGGIICGQKARIQYCEGYWGKVPQCPGPTLNPER